MTTKTADMSVGDYLKGLVEIWSGSPDRQHRAAILREIEDVVAALRNVDR